MGSMHGMDSTPDLGEMDDFMEKRMNQDLDSFTDSMGLWSDMMMSEQNASEHCLETMATIVSLFGLAQEEKGPNGFQICGSSNAHAQSPI